VINLGSQKKFNRTCKKTFVAILSSSPTRNHSLETVLKTTTLEIIFNNKSFHQLKFTSKLRYVKKEGDVKEGQSAEEGADGDDTPKNRRRRPRRRPRAGK
jgi:hypothetical protein